MGEVSNKEKEGYTVGIELLYIAAIFLLAIHIIWYCHEFFTHIWVMQNWIYPFLFDVNASMALFVNPFWTKALALLLIVLHSMGSKGKLDQTIDRHQIFRAGGIGLFLFLASTFLLYLKEAVPVSPFLIDSLYLILLVMGTFYLTKAGQYMSRIVWYKNKIDIFNDSREEFPQNELYQGNEYSVHFRFQYRYGGEWREGIINVVNPFRAIMVMGVPGSGKTYFILGPAIWQSIYKGYTAYIYDFKFPDLAESAYNAYLKTIEENPFAWSKELPEEEFKRRIDRNEPLIPRFCIINFNDVEYSHRCNPLLPELMIDIMDAVESAKSIYYNLNREAAKKQGDFFNESAINLLTAVIWYLRLVARKYSLSATALTGQLENGSNLTAENREAIEQDLIVAQRLSNVCTLPHVVEFFKLNYMEMFGLMGHYADISALMGPFRSALDNQAFDQLEGQIGSIRIPIARLFSPTIYWIMTGNDFSLDLNNPEDPKIICAGNNPERKDIIGAALSLYSSRMMKLMNKKGRLKSALFMDELPTIFMKGIDELIATARSNKVATWLGIQDFEQLKRDYGDKEAEVIINTVGNYFTGQVAFGTAEKLSKLFGKNNQEKESMTLNKQDNSFTVAQEKGELLPSSKLMGLRTGEFAGQSADNLGQTAEFRKFKANISNEPGVIGVKTKIPKFNDLNPLLEKQFSQDPAWTVDDKGPVPPEKLPAKLREYFKEQLLRLHVKRIQQDMILMVNTELADFGFTIDEKSRTKWTDHD